MPTYPTLKSGSVQSQQDATTGTSETEGTVPWLPSCVPEISTQVLPTVDNDLSERPIVEDLRQEFAAIRAEISNHNSQLVALLAQRFEDFVCRHGEVPEKFSVSMPNGPVWCEGTYMLVQGSMPNGFPVWKQVDGMHWIYSMRSGKWGIGGEQEDKESFNSDGAHVFCPKKHFGTMPHKMRSTWKRNNPAWTSDSEIVVQAADPPERSAPPPSAHGAAWEIKCAAEGRDMTRSSSLGKQSIVRSSMASRRITMPPTVSGWSDPERRDALRFSQAGRPRFSEVDEGAAKMASRKTEAFDLIPKIGVAAAAKGKKQRQTTMFPDAEKQKRKLYDNILKDEYRVENKYSKTGMCQFIARQSAFELVTLAVVFLNALWIGYDADKNPADALPNAPMLFQVAENLFCSYFTMEILIRFGAFELKRDAFKDFQFLSDLALVALMIFETWFVYVMVRPHSESASSAPSSNGTSLLRMLRLSRMARLVRLLRAVPELMVLLKGIKAATKSVAWTSGLLVIIVYVFAVLFRILCKTNNLGKDKFKSVPAAMAIFLLEGLLPDFAGPVTEIGNESFFFGVLFMIFIIFGSITVMNMLTGMLVQVVSYIAETNVEEGKLVYVKQEIERMVASMGVEEVGKLSKEEVENLLCEPEACRVLAEVGVDVVQFVELAEFHLFKDSDHISFREFLDLILQLRQAKAACLRDIVHLQQFISTELACQEDRLEERLVECLLGALKPPARSSCGSSQGRPASQA